MNYELAKKLKDAGFPQKRHYDIVDFLSEPLPDGTYDKNDFVAIPTLEELIEACGNAFTRLFHVEKRWGAGNKVFFMTGDTSSEAVANLWLELNKK